jgi:hypothetical protein
MSDDEPGLRKVVTVHFLRKDGSESAAPAEPGADGGFTFTVPADCDGITGFTLNDGTRTRIGMAGGGGGESPGVVVTPGKTMTFGGGAGAGGA